MTTRKSDFLKTQKDIKIEDLLLDPNNPRFSKHLEERVPREKISDKEVQMKTFELMNASENNFQIDELVQAIITDGYINVDKIFVEKINNKYLVIEGNRRVTAIKKIFDNNARKLKGFSTLDPELETEISKISCVVIDADKPGAREMMRTILGLRHHGSILPWKPLPAAFNLYEEYMLQICNGDAEKTKNSENFIYSQTAAKKVASMFSVKLSEVRKKIRLYRVYVQLADAANHETVVVNSDSFSLIEETTNKTALTEFFGFNEEKSIFSEDGVENILDLYFGLRGKEPVITQASAGDSNVRDFAYVISEGTPEDKDRIIKNREKAGIVASDVKAKRSHRNLQSTLELVLEVLNKINLGEIGTDGFALIEKDFISGIDKKMNQLKRAAGL